MMEPRHLADMLIKKQWSMATAESCTGGLIAAACTELSGSSQWFDRGYVTYSNAAKAEMLGLEPALIEAHGAVSEPVACAMALGALKLAEVQVALSVTGIAGPSGGSTEKPVGTVWFAWAGPWGVHSQMQVFSGDRNAVRSATVQHALNTLLTTIQHEP